jgi:hypothetical protein
VFYAFLLIVGLLSLGFYALFILNLVPGAKEERLGGHEPLPPGTGTWKRETESEQARAAEREGLVREVRHYFYEADGRLVLQARYKQPGTGEVVRADAERSVKRRRIRK